MSNWWIVDKNTKRMIDCFDDAGKANCSIGVDHLWLQVPEGVLLGACKVAEAEDGTLSLIASSDKISPRWAAMRLKRDGLLAACDWTQLADSPMASDAKTAWATYRQALRDLPANTEDPDNASWPIKPS